MSRHYDVGPFMVYVGRLNHPGDQALGLAFYSPFASDPDRGLSVWLGTHIVQITRRTR